MYEEGIIFFHDIFLKFLLSLFIKYICIPALLLQLMRISCILQLFFFLLLNKESRKGRKIWRNIYFPLYFSWFLVIINTGKSYRLFLLCVPEPAPGSLRPELRLGTLRPVPPAVLCVLCDKPAFPANIPLSIPAHSPRAGSALSVLRFSS